MKRRRRRGRREEREGKERRRDGRDGRERRIRIKGTRTGISAEAAAEADERAGNYSFKL